MRIGVVGHESAKFTVKTEDAAKNIIRSILTKDDILISGGCHLGGIDIWSEEIATEVGIPKHNQIIHLPKRRIWNGGYRDRNLKIANDSDIVYCIVIEKYPKHYTGMKFDYCYHCKSADHIKSGGCWTAIRAKKQTWFIIKPDGTHIERSFDL